MVAMTFFLQAFEWPSLQSPDPTDSKERGRRDSRGCPAQLRSRLAPPRGHAEKAAWARKHAIHERFDMKTMQEKDIPAFVQAVVEAGCNICAIGNLGYVFGDADLTPAQRVRRATAAQDC